MPSTQVRRKLPLPCGLRARKDKTANWPAEPTHPAGLVKELRTEKQGPLQMVQPRPPG